MTYFSVCVHDLFSGLFFGRQNFVCKHLDFSAFFLTEQTHVLVNYQPESVQTAKQSGLKSPYEQKAVKCNEKQIWWVQLLL